MARGCIDTADADQVEFKPGSRPCSWCKCMHESEDMYRGRNHSTQAATWSSVATWTAISSPRAQELFLNESDKVRGTPIMMFRALVSPFDLAAVAFALEVPHHPRVVSASCPKSIGSGVGALQSSPSPSLPLIIIIFRSSIGTTKIFVGFSEIATECLLYRLARETEFMLDSIVSDESATDRTHFSKWLASRVVKVRFGQVQSEICRTENWTLGSVLPMYRTLDRTVGPVLNSLVLVPKY